MNRPQKYVFVFWGQDFEETPATIFVSELRRAGHQVRVVGLNMQQLTGVHGLSLIPDLTLEQALPLAHRATCVMFPCRAKHLVQFSHDPRIAEFVHKAVEGGRKIIIGRSDPSEIEALKANLPADATVIDYSEHEDLVRFARELPASSCD